MVEWLHWDWQKGEDAEEGDPAQGALQVGLFYFLALEAERREQGGRKLGGGVQSLRCWGFHSPGTGKLYKDSLGMEGAQTSGLRGVGDEMNGAPSGGERPG